MRKKILCILLAFVVMLTFSACIKKTASDPTPAPTASAAPGQVADAIPNAVLNATSTPAPIPDLTPRPTRSPAPETPMPLSSAAPKPSASSEPAPSATPAAVAAAQNEGPTIIKQPKAEGHYIGESAVFTAEARNWTSIVWTAVSPSGREVDLGTFRKTFPDCTVLGGAESTLTITNLNIDMNGWSFYCTFKNDRGENRTDSARLRVRDPNSDTSSSSSGTAVTTKSKRLRCPDCGSEVPRDLLNCPYCGAEIYTKNEYAYVNQDQTGDIFYMDNTGVMYYNNADRTSTYMDTNTNYTVFNDSGLIHSGNVKEEEKKAEEEARLNALLSGDASVIFDMMEAEE